MSSTRDQVRLKVSFSESADSFIIGRSALRFKQIQKVRYSRLWPIVWLYKYIRASRSCHLGEDSKPHPNSVQTSPLPHTIDQAFQIFMCTLNVIPQQGLGMRLAYSNSRTILGGCLIGNAIIVHCSVLQSQSYRACCSWKFGC